MPAPKSLRPKATLAVRNAVVATCDRGPSDAGLLPGGAVAVDDRRVAWVGRDRDLEAAVDLEGARILDADGRLVTPGLVDSHTHLVFAGERAGEFALRCSGKSYLDVALAGGGIAVTTRSTQAASDRALFEGAVARARRLLAQGVTTVEVKSGYGLSPDGELRMLRIVHELSHALWAEQTVVPTLLVHGMPPERADDRVAFVREVCEELVPRLHADQLTSGGGAQLAAETGCASADHLEEIDDAGIEALARAGVVAGLLPLSTLFLGSERYAPARRLLAAGATRALASNQKPRSAMSENVLSLACLKLRLSPAEALVASTAGGARSLRRSDLGRLSPGCEADLVLWGCSSVEHLAWHMAVNHALAVVKRGRVVHEARGAAVDCR